MASPTYGTAGTRLAIANSDTAAVDVPDDVVSGSVILVFIQRSVDGSGGSYIPLDSMPSGFSLVPDNPGVTSGSFHANIFDVAWKRATGADSASPP